MILIKDAADDNAYDYDTTSTLSVKRLESLRENFPENYHPDTVIDMAQPDIGYHYLRRIANDDPINDQNRHVFITFKQADPGPAGVEAYWLYLIVPNNPPQFLQEIPKDLQNIFLESDVAGSLSEIGNYHLMVDSVPEFGIPEENGPEINILIDTHFYDQGQ